MLERRSALATAHAYQSPVLKIAEAPGFSLTQAAGDDKAISAVLGDLPPQVGLAVTRDDRSLFRIGPHHFWIVGPDRDDAARRLNGVCKLVPLSSSRTRILLDGAPARSVLSKGIALDFHPGTFTPGMFAQTGLHHMPVLIHCLAPDSFHIYAMRTFAMTVWDWLTDAALEFSSLP
jgi:sarcosine oxidase subunit gamma